MLAPGRSHDVPEEHLGPVEVPGIMVVDRYKAYQAIDKVKSGPDRAGVLLGPRAARLPGGGAELAGPGELGVGLGGADRRVVSTQ